MLLSRDPDLAHLSDRQLKKQIAKDIKIFRHLDGLDPSVVTREGEERATLDAMDAAHARITAANKQLGLRQHEEWIASGPARKAYRDWEDESAKKKKELKPAREAMAIIARFAHRELQGETLVGTRLSREEALELRGLAEKRLENGRTFETPEETEFSDAEEARYRTLVGQLAGEADLFARHARERALEARREAVREEERVAALPRGGDAVIPAIALEWHLQTQGLTPSELGTLAAVVLALSNEQSPFRDSHFENGEIIISSGNPELPNNDPVGESGYARVRPCLETLALNEFIAAERRGVELRIKAGRLLEEVNHGQPTE